MIQRIQTIYLLLAAISAAMVYKLPFASISESNEQSPLFRDGIYSVYDQFVLVAFFALICFCAIVTLFCYKNRKLQIKLSLWGAVSSALAMLLVVFLFLQDSWAKTNFSEIKDEFGLGMPFFALLFFLLARYNTVKDEQKVQSMDRLR